LSKFIAAMDNSGGSAGGVLDAYGVEWNDANKIDLVHEFRMRMIAAPAFNSNNIWAAIVYRANVERGIVEALNAKGVQVFLKIDQGVKSDGTLQLFDVGEAVNYAVRNNCVGTKMRSVINPVDYQTAITNIKQIVEQQFTIAKFISDKGLMPIVEPEINIHHSNKRTLEYMLREELKHHLDQYTGKCILKLTLPEEENYYSDLLEYDAVEKIVALSGGYTTDEACQRLSQQKNMSASFSRATSEGLTYNLTDAEFDAKLEQNIAKIKAASKCEFI